MGKVWKHTHHELPFKKLFYICVGDWMLWRAACTIVVKQRFFFLKKPLKIWGNAWLALLCWLLRGESPFSFILGHNSLRIIPKTLSLPVPPSLSFSPPYIFFISSSISAAFLPSISHFNLHPQQQRRGGGGNPEDFTVAYTGWQHLWSWQEIAEPK